MRRRMEINLLLVLANNLMFYILQSFPIRGFIYVKRI